MSGIADSFWTEETSVVLKSFERWIPTLWGTIGWSNAGNRENVLRETTDPFIAVFSILNKGSEPDPDLKGKIAGFYLVTHEQGHRDHFTDRSVHGWSPTQWQHSLRGIRAFTYLPKQRMSLSELNPDYGRQGVPIAANGKVLLDPQEKSKLRELPWIEVPSYDPGGTTSVGDNPVSSRDRVRAGPPNDGGYLVSKSAQRLWELYVLRLDGDTGAYLGRPSGGREIYKIGLSVSPELRRKAFQDAMPRGAFEWRVEQTTTGSGLQTCESFYEARAGEDAMKDHLETCADYLGGEFYLAKSADIADAWRLGHEAVKSLRQKS